MPGTTQSAPAEGPREDDAAPAAENGGQGVSAPEPAEGADDIPPATPGSPRG